jgi:hypothetical protein
MAGKASILLVLLLLAVLFDNAQALLTTERFKNWFWYDDSYDVILHMNCSTEYTNFLNRYDDRWYSRWPMYDNRKHDQDWVYLHPVIHCLLDASSEFNKVNMASAGILLGLMPTILAYAGSNLAETALLSMRRPMLAFLLAMGSPAVPPLRTFTHEDIPKMLTRRKGGMTVELSTPTRGRAMRAIVVGVELALSLAAIANVVYTSYELGVKTFISWSTDLFFHPLLWTCLTGLSHLWGVMVLQMDVNKVSPPSYRNKSIRQRLRAWAEDEFTPCASQESPTILKYKPDTFPFLLLSWWAALFTLAHFIYGTVYVTPKVFRG